MLLKKVNKVIPKLRPEYYKGQAGRICIIGGCDIYTGAPYYSGISCLKAGADLSFVICSKSATLMKTYSPELIVLPILPETGDKTTPEEVIQMIKDKGYFERIHCFVIGPGLGRDPITFETIEKIIETLIKNEKNFVLDGDALFLLTQKPNLIKGYKKVILTPNIIEFSRLEKKLLTNEEMALENKEKLNLISSKLGNVLIVQKGKIDLISNGKDEILECNQEGSNRRCGGQGDILAGNIGLFVHWNEWMKSDDLKLACFSACSLTRHAAKLAYVEHKRGTTTPEIIAKIPKAFEELFDEE
eukprot:gene10921-3626_t